VALGTDSLASNATLDLRREMALLRTSFPRLAPAEVFTMATRNGARALGEERTGGRLARGGRASFVAWQLAARGPEQALDELTSAEPPVVGVWVGGVERLARV
jgi:imidazolonepropionase-like amidohydrolase